MVIYLQNLKISHQRVCEHWKHQVSVKYTSTIKLLLSFISITIQPHFRILIYCSIVCVYSDLFLICSILQITCISAINQNADWWKYCRRNAIYSDLLVYYGYLMADDALPIRIWFFRLRPVHIEGMFNKYDIKTDPNQKTTLQEARMQLTCSTDKTQVTGKMLKEIRRELEKRTREMKTNKKNLVRKPQSLC